MKWQGREGSKNIEDRRGVSGRKIAAGGGGFAIILLIVGLLMGGDPQKLLSDFASSNTTQQSPESGEETQEEKNLFQYASVTLADNEKVWNQLFAQNNSQYREPTMVIFRA